jgi:ABC-type multidrug transport system ATPase subunit
MMKIVFVEVRDGQTMPDRQFSGQVIRAGRDPKECQIVFEQAKWPMVSRRHAEFRFTNGICLLSDTKSSYGTFLNGARLGEEPVEIKPGARIQFGGSGPMLLVKQIEFDVAQPPVRVPTPDMETLRDFRPEPTPSGVSPSPHVTDVPTPTPKPGQLSSKALPAFLEPVDNTSMGQNRLALSRETTRFGRDPENDIPIDAAAAVVSRRHAEIRKEDGRFVISDLGSFNGTLINNRRITEPTPLNDADRIQLGPGGPEFLFRQPHGGGPATQQNPPSDVAPAVNAPQWPAGGGQPHQRSGLNFGTIVAKGGTGAIPLPGGKAQPGQPATSHLLMQVPFGGRTEFTIGRSPESDIRLDGLQISNRHARIINSNGSIRIEDTNSTNGVYVNGTRITGQHPISQTDVVQVGPFLIQVDTQRGVAVFDTRSKTRIDVIDIIKDVPNRSGGGKIRLLDDVDLTIQPNEFVGLLGPSGAGKSTLMDSINGMRPATSGHVLINNLDLYQHLDSLKQSIGYVPQDDIIHRELTVYRTLYYVARLRLSRDVSTREIDQIVNEVMDVTGLSERRDVPVGQLSGGQRKRVSIAVELITKPSVIFLDEPTSGLDPATEEKIMKLFRQIAESGRTVILTTHAMENVRLFDKIVVMMRGKLVFYGAPQEALEHVGAESFKELYDRLEAPVEKGIAALPPLPPNATPSQKAALKKQKEQIAEDVAEEWKKRFHGSEQYRRNVVQPLSGLRDNLQVAPLAKRSVTVTDSLRQWLTLSRRYMEVLFRDRFNLLILFAQAPIIAILTYLVVSAKAPRDFPFFILALVAVWFGTSVAAREIIRERAVYARERMVNLGLLPYIGSKLLVLSIIVGLQCILLFGTLKAFDLVGLMKLPGFLIGIPQLFVVLLTAMVGIAIGLLISAVVKTSEMATSLVPLILIPQILFSGLVGVPAGVSKVAGLVMPATWSFDEIKRLAPVDTLQEEGSDPEGPNKGRGLYGYTEDVNDQNIEKARKDLERYKVDAQSDLDRFSRNMKDFVREAATNPGAQQPETPEMGKLPDVPAAVKVSKDLSSYVNFLHPWGNVVLDPLMLLIMFFGLLVATALALKRQDVR